MNIAVVSGVYTTDVSGGLGYAIAAGVLVIYASLFGSWAVSMDSDLDYGSSKDNGKFVRFVCTLVSLVLIVVALVVFSVGTRPKTALDTAKIESGYSITDLQSDDILCSDKLEKCFADGPYDRSVDVSFLDKKGIPHDGTLDITDNEALLTVGVFGHEHEYKIGD